MQALNEMRRNEIKRLEKELTETKMQGETKIDELQEKLLVSESEYQRAVTEYQRQCGKYFILIIIIFHCYFI